MENVFNTLEETPEVKVEVEAPQNDARTARKEKIKVMEEALKTTIAEDPNFLEKKSSLSEALEVINTLGFGDSGGIVVDKTKSDGRALAQVSATVGYKVRNNGTEPIKYKTEIFAQDETGKFVGTVTEKVLSAGEEADLTRQYMTMIAAAPEFSFQLANGKIVRGSGARGDKSLKAELEAHYFKFDKTEDGETIQVHDDSIKLNVGEEVGGKWVVKPEYAEAFGYLNNPKEATGGRRRKSAGKQYNAQEIAANYINRLIQDQSL